VHTYIREGILAREDILVRRHITPAREEAHKSLLPLLLLPLLQVTGRRMTTSELLLSRTVNACPPPSTPPPRAKALAEEAVGVGSGGCGRRSMVDAES